MKRISLVIVSLLTAAACKGNPPPAKPDIKEETKVEKKEEPKAEAGTSCDKEIALECPEGQIDGCLKTPREGDVHACVAK